MSAELLFNNLKSFLRLKAKVVSKVGNHINVGEKFTLRFTGSNTAYSPSYSKPTIVFKKPRIFVRGTAYARPVNGAAWHNLPDTMLSPGESSFVDIEFEATDDLGFWNDLFSEEHVAVGYIFADLDQDRFFQIRRKMDVYEEIEET